MRASRFRSAFYPIVALGTALAVMSAIASTIDPEGGAAQSAVKPAPPGGPTSHGSPIAPVALGNLSTSYALPLTAFNTGSGTFALNLHYAHSKKTWQYSEGARFAAPDFEGAPFGTSSGALHWWHSLYSFIQWVPLQVDPGAQGEINDSPETYSVRLPGGQLISFMPESDQCPSSSSTFCLEKVGDFAEQDRLYQTTNGFMLRRTDGSQYYFEAMHENTLISKVYFLTRIETLNPNRLGGQREQLTLTYTAPVGCDPGVAAPSGTPYIREAKRTDGATWIGQRLRFVYTTVNGRCVLSRIEGTTATNVTTNVAEFVYDPDYFHLAEARVVADNALYLFRTSPQGFTVERAAILGTYDPLLEVTVSFDRRAFGTDGGSDQWYATFTSDRDHQWRVGSDGGASCGPGGVGIGFCRLQEQWLETNTANVAPARALSKGDGSGATASIREIFTLRGVGADDGTADPNYWPLTGEAETMSARTECLTGCTGTHRQTEWSGAVPTWVKRPSGNYDVWAYDSSRKAISRERIGATTQLGDNPLIDVSYTYLYGPESEGFRAMPEKVIRASVVEAGSTVTEVKYDGGTGGDRAPSAVVTTGKTRQGGTTLTRYVKTFYRHTSVWSENSGAGGVGRLAEVEGPCFVSAESASACLSNETRAVTAYFYYGAGEGLKSHRLQRVERREIRNGVLSPARVTHYLDYDEYGRVLSEATEGITTTRVYDGTRLATVTTAGRTTSYTYDHAGRVLSAHLPSGEYEVNCYLEPTPPSDSVDCWGVDNGRLNWKGLSPTSTLSDWRIRSEYTYGSQGRVVKEARSRRTGSSTFTRDVVKRTDFDPFGRPTFEEVGEGTTALKTVSTFSQEDLKTGQRLPYSASALVATMQYDRANRLSVLNERPSSLAFADSHFEYDAHGNVSAIAMGCQDNNECYSEHFARYQHDDFGNLVETSLPAYGSGVTGGTARYGYDAAGRLLTKQTPEMARTNASIAYEYDGFGRTLKVSANNVDGGVAVLQVYRYDEPDTGCSADNTVGHLADQHDSFGRATYSYSDAGEVVEVKRVRRSAAAQSCSATWSHDTPNTQFTYLPDGRISSETYLHGRRVNYSYGDLAVSTAFKSGADQVTGISIDYASAPRELVKNVVYAASGDVISYQLVGAGSAIATVTFSRGAAESVLNGCSTTIGTPDFSNRVRAVTVTRPGSADITPDVFRKYYQWSGDQIVGEATCLLGQSLGTTQYPSGPLKGYDNTLRLVHAKRPPGQTIAASGGTFGTRQYTYFGNGLRSSDVHDCWTYTSAYESGARRERLSSRVVSSWDCTGGPYPGTLYGSGFSYDHDGRVTEKWTPSAFASGPNHRLSFGWSLDENAASTGSAHRSVTLRRGGATAVAAATYQYFYDALGRRRQKVYPLGAWDEFYWSGTQLLEDRGNNTVEAAPTSHPIDEYIWLQGRPVAMVKSAFNTSWQRTGDVSTADCTRNGQQVNCGIYFIVTDHIGKPVVMLDEGFKVTGTGEYDPFGHVNRVLYPADSPRDSATKNHLTNRNTILAYLTQPTLANVNTFVRPRFAMVDTDTGTTTQAFLTRVDESLFGTESYSGPNQGARVGQWRNLGAEDGRFRIRFRSGSTNSAGRKGIILEGYDLWRVEVRNGTPVNRVWTPLRFPGQYHDPETDLFENWNRFYDPSVGRYLSPDPILLSPGDLVTAAANGIAYPAYAYAANNPVAYTDSMGLEVQFGDQTAARLYAAAVQTGNTGTVNYMTYLEESPLLYRIYADMPKSEAILKTETGGALVAGVAGNMDETESGFEGPDRISVAPDGAISTVGRDGLDIRMFNSSAFAVGYDARAILVHELGHAVLYDMARTQRPGWPEEMRQFLPGVGPPSRPHSVRGWEHLGMTGWHGMKYHTSLYFDEGPSSMNQTMWRAR